MSEENQREQFAARTIVYHTPAMDDVVITGGVAYGTSESEDLIMDIYRPADAEGPLPAVVLVTGFPDPGYRARLGCRQKEMGSYISWARAIAACGLAAITYSNTNPVDDIHTLLDHLEAHGDSLGIDGQTDRAVVLFRQCAQRPGCSDGPAWAEMRCFVLRLHVGPGRFSACRRGCRAMGFCQSLCRSIR